MSRPRRAAAATAILGVAAVALGTPAARADCAGPTLTASAGSDGVLIVEGTAFGTACHDTGPPPVGEGVLGRPATDITVTITPADGGTAHVVATGNADAEYAFRAQVDTPVTGAVVVEATYDASPAPIGPMSARTELTITEPPGPGDAAVVTFGPSEPAAGADATEDQPDGRRSAVWIAAGLCLLALLSGGATWWWGRRVGTRLAE